MSRALELRVERRVTGVRRALVGGVLVGSWGCAGVGPVHDWSSYEGPGERHFQREEVEFPTVADRFEGFNRRVWGANEFLLFEALRPVATGYRWVVPGTVRRGLGRAFDNLLFPGRFVNNALQWQWGAAWTETERFVVNSTAGVLGFQDRARHWGIAPPPVEDFGLTFAEWGWRRSNFVMLPVFGPSTVRDAVGFVGDTAADPASYYFPAAPVRYLNDASDQVEALVSFVRSTFDPYELMKLLYALGRESDVEDYSFESEDTGATETLGAVFLTPEDPEFVLRAENWDVVSPATGRAVPYSVWPQEEPGPLVYVLPGLGGHRLASSTAALAEAVFESGATPVTISSTMNHEFIRTGISSVAPGYVPADARDVHAAIDAIDADLERRFPGRFGLRRIGGVSLGGMTVLMIAAADDRPGAVEFDSYLAVNAPISLEYGIEQLDAAYNAPLEFPPEERQRRIDGIFRKTLDLAQRSLTPTGEGLPFTDVEARFLIGLAFRSDLRNLIYLVEDTHAVGVLHARPKPYRRSLAYREASQFSFMEYVWAYVLPERAAERGLAGVTEDLARDVFDECDLWTYGAALARRGNVVLATNRNDFLLRPGDIQWARETLGEDRVLVFERGGHLGNLGSEDVREAVRRLVVGSDG